MSVNFTYYISTPWAQDGIRIRIPDTPPADGTFNQPQGYTDAYQKPIASGGYYVPMGSFNEVFFNTQIAVKEVQDWISANAVTSVNGQLPVSGDVTLELVGQRVEVVQCPVSSVPLPLPTRPVTIKYIDYIATYTDTAGATHKQKITEIEQTRIERFGNLADFISSSDLQPWMVGDRFLFFPKPVLTAVDTLNPIKWIEPTLSIEPYAWAQNFPEESLYTPYFATRSFNSTQFSAFVVVRASNSTDFTVTDIYGRLLKNATLMNKFQDYLVKLTLKGQVFIGVETPTDFTITPSGEYNRTLNLSWNPPQLPVTLYKRSWTAAETAWVPAMSATITTPYAYEEPEIKPMSYKVMATGHGATTESEVINLYPGLRVRGGMRKDEITTYFQATLSAGDTALYPSTPIPATIGVQDKSKTIPAPTIYQNVPWGYELNTFTFQGENSIKTVPRKGFRMWLNLHIPANDAGRPEFTIFQGEAEIDNNIVANWAQVNATMMFTPNTGIWRMILTDFPGTISISALSTAIMPCDENGELLMSRNNQLTALDAPYLSAITTVFPNADTPAALQMANTLPLYCPKSPYGLGEQGQVTAGSSFYVGDMPPFKAAAPYTLQAGIAYVNGGTETMLKRFSANHMRVIAAIPVAASERYEQELRIQKAAADAAAAQAAADAAAAQAAADAAAQITPPPVDKGNPYDPFSIAGTEQRMRADINAIANFRNYTVNENITIAKLFYTNPGFFEREKYAQKSIAGITSITGQYDGSIDGDVTISLPPSLYSAGAYQLLIMAFATIPFNNTIINMINGYLADNSRRLIALSSNISNAYYLYSKGYR